MTSEMIPRIQEAIDSGQSANSIAKRENIAECTIRYGFKTGKLKRAPKLVRESNQKNGE
jgi:hypothetical protein